MTALLDSLRAWQAKHDYTQEQAATQLGVTLGAYHKWMRGRAKPSRMAREKIEQALGAGEARSEQ